MKATTIRDHPELQRLTAILPTDAELDRLGAALAAAETTEVTARATVRAQRDRADALERQLRAGAVEARGRQSLLLERAGLTVEEGLAPPLLADAARTRARCELTYLARVATLAAALATAAKADHTAALNAWQGPAKQLDRLSHTTLAQDDEARATRRATVAPRAATVAAYAARYEQARALLLLARAFGERHHGAALDLRRRESIEAAATAAGDRAARHVVAPSPVAA
jgi:hypothetical protein